MITALVSRKGGVGKTTTAVNLSAALAGIGKRALLVDLDPQASASLSLGVERAELAPSLADVFFADEPVSSVVRATGVRGLDLVTASIDLGGLDRELAHATRPALRLRAALEPVRSRYDFIVLDCPPNLSLASENALVAADNYLLPVVPHYLARTGVRGLVEAIGRLTLKHGVRPDLLGIVLTMVDYRTKVCRENVERLRERFGADVCAMEIRTNVRLAEAPEWGLTIFQYDRRSTGAKAYRLLGGEILMRGRAQMEQRRASKRRQEAERLRRERRGEPQPLAEVHDLLRARDKAG